MHVLGETFVRIEGVNRACQPQHAREMTGQCGRSRDAPPKAKRSRRNCLFHVRSRAALETLGPGTRGTQNREQNELHCPPSSNSPEATRTGECPGGPKPPLSLLI